MMKTIQHYLIFCFLPTLFTACGVGDNLAMLPETDESGKLTVSFDLNGAGIRMDDATDTRANANVPLENLADGTLFSIRAYKKTYNDKGELTATIFADAGVYKVESGGKTANAYTSVTDAVLQLTRGIYDHYFLSYNSSTVYPGATGDTETITGSTLADVTSKDVIATSMKDVQIQSDQDGQVTLTIPMDGAVFSHLCSRVKARLDIPRNQPVIVLGVSALKITMKPLYGTAGYNWQKGTLSTTGERNNSVDLIASGALSGIDSSTGAATLSSSDVYLFPLNDDVPLEFDVTMTIAYKTSSSGSQLSGDFKLSSPVALDKALLAAKSYCFVFTLTYYGELVPSDLTLDVTSYSPVNLPSDDVGADD